MERVGERGGRWVAWGDGGELINGLEYVFEVRAVNALGKGGVETVQATPEAGGGDDFINFGGGGDGGLVFPPEAPAVLTALAGDGAVRLEWAPPESDGGAAILRYEYRLKEGRGEFGEWTPIPDSAPEEVNAAGFTVMGLGNGRSMPLSCVRSTRPAAARCRRRWRCGCRSIRPIGRTSGRETSRGRN